VTNKPEERRSTHKTGN